MSEKKPKAIQIAVASANNGDMLYVLFDDGTVRWGRWFEGKWLWAPVDFGGADG
jgi:hypothetical protein